MKRIRYHRSGFNCEYAIIANFEFISSSQKLERKKKMYAINSEEVRSLPACKRGRKVHVYVGEELDRKVQNYVRALCSAGTPIGSSVVMAAVLAPQRSIRVYTHDGHEQHSLGRTGVP